MKTNETPIDLLDDPDMVDPDAPIPDEVLALRKVPGSEEEQRDALLAVLHSERTLALAVRHLTRNSWATAAHGYVFEAAAKYFAQYGGVPPWSYLLHETRRLIGDHKSALTMISEVRFVRDFWRLPPVYAYVEDALVRAIRSDILKESHARSIELQKKGDTDGAARAMEQGASDALAVSYEPPSRHVFRLGERIDAVRPEWLCKGWFKRNQVGVLFGDTNCGKTWVALDLALSVACGSSWLGRFPCRQGRVFYVISEGADDFELRAESIRADRGLEVPEGGFVYSATSYDFATPGAVTRCLADLNDQFEDGKADLIVVDTFAKNFGGDGDKNSEVSAYVRAMDELRKATGAQVISLHHTGHTAKERERGASSFRADVDTSVKLTKETLVCTKQKSGRFPDPVDVALRLVTVPGQEDEEGDPVTGLVPEAVDRTAGDPEVEHAVRAALSHGPMRQGELIDYVQRDLGSRNGVTAPGRQKITAALHEWGRDEEAWLGMEQLRERGAPVEYRLLDEPAHVSNDLGSILDDLESRNS